MKKVLLAAVAGTVCLCAACVSCSSEDGLVEVWGGDAVAPRFLGIETVSGTEILARFTAPVYPTAARALVGEEEISVSWSADTGTVPSPGTAAGAADSPGGPDSDSAAVRFVLGREAGAGARAILESTVEDARGNSLSFAVPFTGWNSRPARLRINEVRTVYAKPKVEFVEFLVTGAGNLAGVEIGNAMNGQSPVYEFPPVEVAEGDFIVYHLRSVEAGLVNETGAPDESAGIDSCPTARDFWDTLTNAPLKKTNVITVRERRGGPVMDALLCAESGLAAWPSDEVRLAAEESASAGAWLPGALISDAACTTGTTATRTLGRNPASGDTDSAADWAVCALGKCSPGLANAAN